VNCHGQNQTQGIDNQVPLAAVDVLARVETLSAARLGHFDSLAVEDRSTGQGLPTGLTPKPVPQHVVNSLPGAIVAPAEKDTTDSLPLGEIVWKQTPGKSAAKDIEDRVDGRAPANSLRCISVRRLW
jgi:hypothetical protein